MAAPTEAPASPLMVEREDEGALALAAKGAAMGVAEIIPGVSGGTLAIIVGVYHRLITAIAAVGPSLIADLFAGIRDRGEEGRARLQSALERVRLRFLIALCSGMFAAILVASRVIPALMDRYPAQMAAFFFGLIFISVKVPFRAMPERKPIHIVPAVLGLIIAFVLGGLAPSGVAPTLPYLFMCGVIAISAMILPGISGSALLVVLGVYRYVIDAIKAFDLGVIVVFSSGCAIGILGFSRVLRWALDKFPAATMAALVGLILGALRNVWPFKQTLVDGNWENLWPGKEAVRAGAWRNIAPTFDADGAILLGCAVFGILLVLIIDHVANRRPES